MHNSLSFDKHAIIPMPVELLPGKDTFQLNSATRIQVDSQTKQLGLILKEMLLMMHQVLI